MNLDSVALFAYLIFISGIAAVGLTGEKPLLPLLQSPADGLSGMALTLLGVFVFLIAPAWFAHRVWRDRQRFPGRLAVKQE